MFPFRLIAVYVSLGVLMTLLAACGQAPPSSSRIAPSPVQPAATATVQVNTPAAAATAAPGQQSVDACALITPREAAAALGTGATLPQSEATAGKVPACRFQVEGEVQLSLFVHTYGSVKEALQAEQTSVNRVKDQPTFQKVPGLGDAAFAMGHSLAVRKQATILTLSVTTTKNAASSIVIAKGLAQRALSRLP